MLIVEPVESSLTSLLADSAAELASMGLPRRVRVGMPAKGCLRIHVSGPTPAPMYPTASLNWTLGLYRAAAKNS